MEDITIEELLELVQNTSIDSVDLEPLVLELNLSFESFFVSNKTQYFSTITSKYASLMNKIDKIIRQSQNIISQIEGSNFLVEEKPKMKNEPIIMESKTNIQCHPPHEMFELFVSRELPIVEEPYPPLCGSISIDFNDKLGIDSFVAAKLDKDYVLCYICGYEEEKYYIVDADTDHPVPILMNRDLLIPLPTTLPEKYSSKVEYSIGTKVLSLYSSGDEEWTSVFYPATIIQVPSKREWGYGLKFLEDNEFEWISVPEQFIIPYPKIK